jgi:cell cycle arrest protein BUB3
MLSAKSSSTHFVSQALPTDSISSINFHSIDPDVFLATSWDGEAYFYEASTAKCLAKVNMRSPLLDGIFSPIDKSSAFLAGLDGNVTLVQQNRKSSVIGKHKSPCRSLTIVIQRILASGSWDKTINLFDLASMTKVSSSILLPGAVYSMDSIDNYLVVGMEDRQIYIYDIRKPLEPLQKRESSLKYQTRPIKCFQRGFISSSIEGRVAVEYFQEDSDKEQRYAFKCHRQTQNNIEIVHSVNALAVHPGRKTTFATGGSDGNVYMWDLEHKKRIKHLISLDTTGISSMSFSPDGGTLAVAGSHCFERGTINNGSGEPKILLKILTESDISLKRI